MPKSLLLLPTQFPKLAQSEQSPRVLKNTDFQDPHLAILLLLVWSGAWGICIFTTSLGFSDQGGLGNTALSIGCCSEGRATCIPKAGVGAGQVLYTVSGHPVILPDGPFSLTHGTAQAIPRQPNLFPDRSSTIWPLSACCKKCLGNIHVDGRMGGRKERRREGREGEMGW